MAAILSRPQCVNKTLYVYWVRHILHIALKNEVHIFVSSNCFTESNQETPCKPFENYTFEIKATSPGVRSEENIPDCIFVIHYSDVIMGAIASQITRLTIVYSTVYSGADQRKHQRSASLAFVRGSHRWIPHTNGQLRGKRLHLKTSLW